MISYKSWNMYVLRHQDLMNSFFHWENGPVLAGFSIFAEINYRELNLNGKKPNQTKQNKNNNNKKQHLPSTVPVGKK